MSAIPNTASTLEIVKNGKLEAGASTFTTAAGIAMYLEYISGVLGVFAIMSGLILTWVMICKGRLEMKRIKLAIALDGRRDTDK